MNPFKNYETIKVTLKYGREGAAFLLSWLHPTRAPVPVVERLICQYNGISGDRRMPGFLQLSVSSEPIGHAIISHWQQLIKFRVLYIAHLRHKSNYWFSYWCSIKDTEAVEHLASPHCHRSSASFPFRVDVQVLYHGKDTSLAGKFGLMFNSVPGSESKRDSIGPSLRPGDALYPHNRLLYLYSLINTTFSTSPAPENPLLVRISLGFVKFVCLGNLVMARNNPTGNSGRSTVEIRLDGQPLIPWLTPIAELHPIIGLDHLLLCSMF
ncbi:uncharacterized protein HD556DRAFT_1539357 [Suillus plorans]|uniref:Uncharacterized protein n=1 Tax=Suillus plorans TaxID=116603 RepID=A0A9P7DBT1_9AGAM|nr:uncharacterized protein HD556DRAFT_1539357 [Suillus plorans]KAG1786926.1 hypothetical protein HD556DRAFT_1539357 [Suillus plorans]